ncbi:MAG: response regulator [Nibricoccus sp.]
MSAILPVRSLVTGPWLRATDWMLIHFTQPVPENRFRNKIIVAALILFIGAIDYLTDVRVSLALFYLIPIVLSIAWFSGTAGVLTATASVFVRITGDSLFFSKNIPSWTWWNTSIFYCILLVVVWILNGLFQLHRQLEQRVNERTLALESAYQSHRLLEQELLEIGSRERNAMGRELHDDLCQHLVGTALAAQVLGQQLTGPNETAARAALEIARLTEQGIAKTRQLARGLLLASIEPARLPGELAEIASSLNRPGLICLFKQEGNPVVPNASAAAQLYRIAQEAARNAATARLRRPHRNHALRRRLESLPDHPGRWPRSASCRATRFRNGSSHHGTPRQSDRRHFVRCGLAAKWHTHHLPAIHHQQRMKRTRIFLVDDHPLVREWLANLLRLEADLEISGSADDTPSALAAMTQNPPDIAVVDLSLQRGSGLDLIKDLQTQLPAVQIIVFSMHEELIDVERAFRAGARGYVMKREATARIVAAIHEIRAGRLYANPVILASLAERLVQRPLRDGPATTEDLSDREADVFRRLGEGHSTRRISEDLGVSMKTVQTYCARIKEKLSLNDGAELVRTAVRQHDAGRP